VIQALLRPARDDTQKIVNSYFNQTRQRQITNGFIQKMRASIVETFFCNTVDFLCGEKNDLRRLKTIALPS
jgi:hypothetical protein